VGEEALSQMRRVFRSFKSAVGMCLYSVWPVPVLRLALRAQRRISPNVRLKVQLVDGPADEANGSLQTVCMIGECCRSSGGGWKPIDAHARRIRVPPGSCGVPTHFQDGPERTDINAGEHERPGRIYHRRGGERQLRC
jgi:hypothetical protein